MKFKKFKEDVIIPNKGYNDDGGLDLHIPESFDICSFETKTIGLGLGVSVPKGYVGMLVPRSSIARKGLIIQTSLIDSGYTGEIHLIITNPTRGYFDFEKNSRLCSLIVYKILDIDIEVVEEFEKTERNESRFGSSGE